MALATRVIRIKNALRERPRLWLAVTLGFPVLYYLVMFAALLIRFQALPNYVNVYDWVGNVAEIIRATPAWGDMWPIIAQEWLIEIGRMNYDYGIGISEWSLTIVPVRFVVVLTLAAGIATILSLILARRGQCTTARMNGGTVAGGLGAVLIGMTNVTLSWVVCCSTPSWVVGLAILGLGVSTSLWLEQFGWWIEYAGFAMLFASIFWLSGNPAAAKDATSDNDNSYPQSIMGAPR